MKTLTQLFKKYASGALLLVVLLSPLQSSAAMTSGEVLVFRQQVDLVLQAIETSRTVTPAKKSEMRLIVSSLYNIINVLARQAAANPEAVSQGPANAEDNQSQEIDTDEDELEDPKSDFIIKYE